MVDWEKFSWETFEENSGIVLRSLAQEWKSTQVTASEMAQSMEHKILKIVNEQASTKVVTIHSRPWVAKELSEQLKEMREIRKRYMKHRSMKNTKLYLEKSKEVAEAMEEARIEWRNSQCDKLEDVPERQKWRIINTLTNNQSKTQVQPIRKKDQMVHQNICLRIKKSYQKWKNIILKKMMAVSLMIWVLDK